ncbi:MAG: hypothetical protein WC655_10980, partial [Candidatus Hydrogenedentales bacterium]
MTRVIVLLLFAVTASPVIASAAPVAPSELPATTSLPDPLRLEDGSVVRTPEDWEKRRAEMKRRLLDYEYGHLPSGPFNVEAASVEELGSEEIQGTRHRLVHLVVDPAKRVPIDLHLYTPVAAKTPMPVIVGIGKGCPNIAELNSRGYAFACFAHRELDPDTEGRDDIGPAQAAYPECDWGSVAIWAWGASRALDYLITQPEFDKARVVVTGHSRTGKAALLAGALDERFAITVPNGSGCGGASAFRVYSK